MSRIVSEGFFYKTGRKGKVVEITDRLEPNLLNNNLDINSKFFHRNSGFRFTIASRGKHTYYNIDPQEAIFLSHLMSDGVADTFTRRLGAFNANSPAMQNQIKEIVGSFPNIDFSRFDSVLATGEKEAFMLSFQKNIHIGQNVLLVRKFTISYEKNMNSDSKWKLIIENGTGVKDTTKGNGLNILKYGSYKADVSLDILLQANELVAPINECAKRVFVAEQSFFLMMKRRRDTFTQKKIEEKDNACERIDIWNPEGKPYVSNSNDKRIEEAKKNNTGANNTTSKPSTSASAKVYKCTGCGYDKVNQATNDFSNKKYGKVLCFNCQKNEGTPTNKANNTAPKGGTSSACEGCSTPIAENVKSFSEKKFKKALCIDCQKKEQ